MKTCVWLCCLIPALCDAAEPGHAALDADFRLAGEHAMVCEFDPANDTDPDGCMGPALRCGRPQDARRAVSVFMNTLLDTGWKVERQLGALYYLSRSVPQLDASARK